MMKITSSSKGVTALAMSDRKSGFEHIQQWLSTSDEELFSQMGWIEATQPYYSDADRRSLIIDIIMEYARVMRCG